MARTIDPFTGDKGYQGRTFEQDLAGPYTIDPFEEVQPIIANAPNVEFAAPEITRNIEGVEREGLGPRKPSAGLTRRPLPVTAAQAQPVAFRPTQDFAAERAKRTIPIPLYRGEDVRVAPLAMRGSPSERAVQLTPEQQAIVDAFWDEQDRWMAVDEATGTLRPTARRNEIATMDRGTARSIAELEAQDRAMAIAAEQERALAQRAPRRLI